MKRALVLGKFLPPTLGHKFLIDFARAYRVDGELVDLTVLVATLPSEGIPGALRHRWIAEHFAACPNVRVVHTDEVVPQDPSEHPDFWAIWTDLIARVAGTGFDLVFASEPYGAPLARALGAAFVPVDIERQIVPISGTAVRADPLRHFQQMLPEAQAHFRRRVVLFGAESVGKTTMARFLRGVDWTSAAPAFRDDLPGIRWTPEHARGYLDALGVDVTMAKIEGIARGQMAMEDAAGAQPVPILIQDTDLVATVAWSDILLGGHPAWIEAEAIRRRADLYLVLDDRVGFHADPQRYGGDRRQMTTRHATDLLDRLGGRYEVIAPDPDDHVDLYAARADACVRSIRRARDEWFAPIPQWRGND